jgi:hypothetical protein
MKEFLSTSFVGPLERAWNADPGGTSPPIIDPLLQLLLENVDRLKRLRCEHRLSARTGDLNGIARRVDADIRACRKINSWRISDVDVGRIHHIDV